MSRPHVTLKLATSLDGRIATGVGESRWITGEASRAEVQKLRARSDAVMIGAGTTRADNPSLLARTEPPPSSQPFRVVVTSQFDIPLQGRLFEALDRSPVIVFGAGEPGPTLRAAMRRAGAQIEIVSATETGVDILAVLERLAERGLRRVLIEGGGALAAAVVSADAVDAVEWFRAPIVLGQEGRAAIGPLALDRLADAPRWRRIALRELGPDLWESYERI